MTAADAPMLEGVGSSRASPLLVLLADAGATVEGLRLADGVLVLKVENNGRAVQVRIADDGPVMAGGGVRLIHDWGLSLPVDPVARDTSPEFVAGSHLWRRSFTPERFNGRPLYGEADVYEPLPDIEADRSSFDIRGWDLEPGDVICFHFLTLHGAPVNSSLVAPRRAISVRWIGDDARFARRPGPTSPPFRDITLEPGDEMIAREFPLCWPSDRCVP